MPNQKKSYPKPAPIPEKGTSQYMFRDMYLDSLHSKPTKSLVKMIDYRNRLVRALKEEIDELRIQIRSKGETLGTYSKYEALKTKVAGLEQSHSMAQTGLKQRDEKILAQKSEIKSLQDRISVLKRGCKDNDQRAVEAQKQYREAVEDQRLLERTIVHQALMYTSLALAPKKCGCRNE